MRDSIQLPKAHTNSLPRGARAGIGIPDSVVVVKAPGFEISRQITLTRYSTEPMEGCMGGWRGCSRWMGKRKEELF